MLANAGVLGPRFLRGDTLSGAWILSDPKAEGRQVEKGNCEWKG